MKHKIFLWTGLVLLLLTGKLLSENKKIEFPKPFWNVLLDLGGKEKGREEKGHKAIEEIIRYSKASLYHTELEKKAQAYQEKYDEQIATFDISDIYEVLPFQQENSSWKGNHQYEKLEKGKIQITMDEPGFDKWLNLPKNDVFAPWKSVSHLGDTDQRFYVTPLKNGDGDIRYQTYYFERLGLGTLAPNHLLVGLRSLLIYLEHGVRNAPESYMPGEEIKNQFPLLSTAELYVIKQFSQDMPELYKRVMDYVNVESISTPMKFNGVDFCQFNLKISLKMEGLKKDFPKIYKYLNRIRGLIELKSRMYDSKGHFVGFIHFSTTSFTFHFSFAMKDGRFLPSKVAGEPVNFKGFSFWDLGEEKNIFRNDIKIYANGVRVVVRNIKLDQLYKHTLDTTILSFRMTEVPIIQKVDGRAYGVVPVWLIDLLIPSNIETMLKEFFRTMAEGRNKEGWYLFIRTVSGNNNRVELATGSEILSNGIIRIGMKIAADLLIPDKETSEELSSFGKVFWHAFVNDYFLFRYPN